MTKLILFLVLLSVCLALYSGFTKPLQAQIEAFEMKGVLGEGVLYYFDGKWWAKWQMGKEFDIESSTPVIIKYMKDLEGKEVRVTVEVVKKKK